MNSLYNHGIKQTQLISKDLSSFETNLSTSPLSLQGSITTSLTAFRKTVKEYGDLVRQNNSDESNAKHEQRLEKFQSDLQGFASKFDGLKNQRENIQHEANKQELLGRRHHHAGLQQTEPSDNPFNQPPLQQQQQRHMSQQEGLYNERMSLSRGSSS